MKGKIFGAARALHLLAAAYNLLYVYTPLHHWEHGFLTVQYGSIPLLLATGAMMARSRKPG